MVLPPPVASDRLAVAPDVAILPAHDHDDRVAIARVAHAALRAGIDADDAAGAEQVPAAVAEAELDLALVDEIGLLLLVVVVDPGLVTGREDDRVDPECGYAQLAPDLAKAVAESRGRRGSRARIRLLS